MWHTPPPDDVAKGTISLRSGLLWMVANAYIEIRELTEPRYCIVTGEPVEGRAGVSVVVTATGRAYGRKVQREKGPEVRDSFFLHPNAPSQMRGVKDNNPYRAHLSVAENSGIVGQMAGLFFASNNGGEYRVAPVINQLYSLNQKLRQPMSSLDLICFGFHMLSSKKNIHGGYEHEEFHYPIIGIDEQDVWDVLSAAHDIMASGAGVAQGIDRALAEASQICMLVQTEGKTEKDNRTIAFKAKSSLSPGDIIPALSREYWVRLGVELRVMIDMIGKAGSTRDDLNDARDEIIAWWREQAAAHARKLFDRIFSDYVTSPAHLISAHKAQRLFHARLRDMGVTFGGAGGARPSQPTTMETTP